MLREYSILSSWQMKSSHPTLYIGAGRFTHLTPNGVYFHFYFMANDVKMISGFKRMSAQVNNAQSLFPTAKYKTYTS
jgi:hypothetical protein